MVAFPDRVEATVTVPSGGAAVSATVASGGGATTCTVPAASYYMTAAGGVSSLLTTLQTQLNENVQGYPLAGANVTTATGYGSWSAGWLFNILSGNDTGAFGGFTMTAVSSPTYGDAGPRGGIDKAVGFNSAADAFSAGNNFNIIAANDLALAMVIKLPALSSGYVLGKEGSDFWRLDIAASNTLLFQCDSASGASGVCYVSYTPDEWGVLMLGIDRATGKACAGWLSLSSASTSVSSLATVFAEDISNAGDFTLGANTPAVGMLVSALYIGVGAGYADGLPANLATALANFKAAINSAWVVSMSSTTGLVSIGWTGYATPTWSLAWTSTELRDVLGFDANITSVTTTQTGAAQAKGVWLPDCPTYVDGDPGQAPIVTDRRSTTSPTKALYALCGNYGYEHTGLVYTQVPRAQVWESEATYANGSWETFARDCIMGLGHDWFTASSPLQFYWYDGSAGSLRLLGAEGNSGAGMAGWQVVSLNGINPKRAIGDWAGAFRIEIGTVVADA